MRTLGQILAESGRGFWYLVQSGQSVAEHELQIQGSRWLIQGPERLGKVGIQFEELSNQPLRDLSRGQIHLVQSTKQRQQIEPGRFQTGAEIGRDFHRGATGHGPSMAHGATEVN